MRVLIIEDEIPAQQQLIRLLNTHYPQAQVLTSLDSIEAAASWLEHNQADLILMDVELADGVCFELFNRVQITSAVVITTAYEHYALNALKASCVDYLLKPIGDEEFVQAIEKCKSRRAAPIQLEGIERLLRDAQVYKQRFVLKVGDQIHIVNLQDIAYFYSEQKSTYIVTHKGMRYLSDLSLDAIEKQVNPKEYFKLSRSCICSINSIVSISKHFNSRLCITLKPEIIEPVLVSRLRVPVFMDWIEGK